MEAIAPAVGLAITIGHWNEIAAALGERNRKRTPQLSRMRSHYENHRPCIDHASRSRL